MIANINNCSCASGFTVNIGDICSDFVIKNRLWFLINTLIWDSFKGNIKFAFVICCRFTMSYFLWFAIKIRSTPVPPSWILYFTFYSVSDFSIANITTCVGFCITFYGDAIVDLEGFGNWIKMSLKFWTFIFFNRKIMSAIIKGVIFS